MLWTFVDRISNMARGGLGKYSGINHWENTQREDKNAPARYGSSSCGDIIYSMEKCIAELSIKTQGMLSGPRHD